MPNDNQNPNQQSSQPTPKQILQESTTQNSQPMPKQNPQESSQQTPRPSPQQSNQVSSLQQTPSRTQNPAQNPQPSRRLDSQLVTHDLSALMAAGVVVEVDPDVAEAMGAFEETALTEAEAWESNADIDTEAAEHV